MTLLLGLAAFAAGFVFFWSLQRKVALSKRWEESTRRAIREWNVEAAQDAKDAVDEELVWTWVLIVSMIAWLLLCVATVDSL